LLGRQRIRKVYLLKARLNGRQRWITIGEHGAPWIPDEFERLAMALSDAERKGTENPLS
jgi:hypothetical protein